MNPFTEAVISSIVGGLVLSLLALLFHHTLIPAIRAALTHELQICGTWHCRFVSRAGNAHDLTLELRQRFRTLSGRLHVMKHLAPSGKTESKLFVTDGHLRDRFVTISARNADPQAIGVFVLLLEVLGDARQMSGRGIWYSVTKQRIEQSDFEWKKADARTLSTF